MYTRSVTERGLPPGCDGDMLGACFEKLASWGPLARTAKALKALVGPRGLVETRLSEGQMLSVCGFGKVVVSCRGGRAIATAEGIERDMVLESGQTVAFQGNGRVVVTAAADNVRICVSGG